MSQDLNYGYKKPVAGDESATQFCDIISNDIERFSEHSHDGEDSAVIPSSSVSRYGTDLTAQRIQFPSVVITSGDTTVDLLSLGATAGMYVKSQYVPSEVSILSMTGTLVTLSLAPTGSGTDTLELSTWKRMSSSVFQKEITLPSGYPSNTSMFKFYIITVSSDYYNQEVFPSVIYDDLNTVTVQVNNNDYDMRMVIL